MASEAKINSDAEKLAVLLRLLEYERQTWQTLCDKMGSDKSIAAPAQPRFTLQA
jgi:hypothetical protein